MTEEELKAELEAAEVKKDEEAKAVLEEAVKKIDALGRVVVSSATFIGQQVEWRIGTVRKK